MKDRQRQAFTAAMGEARLAYRQRRWVQAFALLERAHVLGQKRVVPHVQSHWWMLKVGLQRRDAGEVRGQLLRLPAAILMSRLWVPLGNTGGANVSPLQPLPIADDLRELMETD